MMKYLKRNQSSVVQCVCGGGWGRGLHRREGEGKLRWGRRVSLSLIQLIIGLTIHTDNYRSNTVIITGR